MADSAASSHGMPTMREVIEAAEKAGEAPPTVEAYLRDMAYPFPEAPYRHKYDCAYEHFLDGKSSSAKPPFPALGLYHLPTLGSILSNAGLAFQLSQARPPPDTSLASVPPAPPNRWHHVRPFSRVPSSSHDLRNQFASLGPELIPLCTRLSLVGLLGVHQAVHRSEPKCDCTLDKNGRHLPLPWHLVWPEPAEDILLLLQNLRLTSAADQTSLHAWEYQPMLEATSPWRRLHEIIAACSTDSPVLIPLLGKTCFVPLVVLDVASSDCSSPPPKQARGTQLSDLGLRSEEVAAILAHLAPSPRPSPTRETSGSSSRLIVFGPEIPIDASLPTHGASYIHTVFGAGSLHVEAVIRSQVSLLRKDIDTSPTSPSGKIATNGLAPALKTPATVSPLRQEYRLVTFDELQKCKPLLAVFVCSDGSLATLHTLSPLFYGTATPELISRPEAASPSRNGASLVKNIEDPAQQAVKPLLLLSASTIAKGNQGKLYRAHCADSPFRLLAKYSHADHVSKMAANEAAFYHHNGSRLVTEKLAPRFGGGWSTEGRGSPYTKGSSTTMLLLEEWGERVTNSDWFSVSRETRLAVQNLAIRFHLKLGYCHKSLRSDNILWKPDVGPASLRLIDFAGSEKSCTCMKGTCCDELYALDSALHRVETHELVMARCEVEKAERARKAEGEVAQTTQEQARREAELGA